MKYALITTDDGANPGDSLLTENAKAILNNVFKGKCICEVSFAEKPESYIDQINSADICFFTTISYHNYDVFVYYNLIKKIKIPVIAMASSCALQRFNIIQDYKLSKEIKEAINIVNSYSDIIPVRDVFTKFVLDKNGREKVELTGDLGCFNFGNPIQKIRHPSEIKKILITTGHQPDYNNQMLDIVSYLVKKFPKAEIVYSSHGKTFDFGKTNLKDSIKIEDASVTCDKMDFYQNFDLHVGYRLHGHIKCLSIGIPSILMAEDFRGVGQQYTLGNVGVFKAFECCSKYDFTKADSKNNMLQKLFYKLFSFKTDASQNKTIVRFLGLKLLTVKTKYSLNEVRRVVRIFDIKFKRKTSLIKNSNKLISEINKHINKSISQNWTNYDVIPTIINNLYRNAFLPFLQKSIENALNNVKVKKNEDKNSPSLEVIILTYNRAGYFEQALRSVCNQTYKDFTIKVLNNGSTDNTEEVFYKVTKEYPERKFNYLKLPENHLDDYYLAQRNKFITSDYVIIFHDDDLMHPRYIEHLMNIIPYYPNCVLLGAKKKISEHPENLDWDNPKGKYVIRDVQGMIKMYLKHDTFTFPSLCYKSNILKSTPPRPDLYGNANDFGAEIDIAKQGEVCELQDKFVHYRMHNGQDRQPRSIQQRINMAKRYAEYLLEGDADCVETFCDYVKKLKSADAVLYYFLISKYRKVSSNINKIFKKDKKARKFRKLKRKMLFYRLMCKLTNKISSALRNKYAYRYKKAEKKFLKEFRDYKIAMRYLQSDLLKDKENLFLLSLVK